MIPEAAAWAIFGLPLAAFLVIVFVIRPFFNSHDRLSGYVTILALAGALVLSVWALASVMNEGGTVGFEPHEWFSIGAPSASGSFVMTVGVLLDPLTAIMLIVVSGVSLMVQVYSQGYMKGDGGYSRYFAYMALFTSSMLGLVLARNLIQLYLFWELVGLSSYLLIGFWYHRPAAAAAAKKAFIITRVGDFGFLLVLLYLFFHRADPAFQGLDPFDIPTIHVAAGLLASGVVTWMALGLFAGAVGKSAQFPLHTWLPDAMEGPTPVSSLIHAVTMVAAGVFLVARMFPVFEHSEVALNLVAVIGGFTAIFAATMGLVSNDIKRVLAYSTVSQLGYMTLALGVGAPVVAMFHLFNHAFFKCLLFLGAGSVSHATGTFDMRYMGGLRRVMPWTYVTFLAASASIAGVPLLSGTESQDVVWVLCVHLDSDKQHLIHLAVCHEFGELDALMDRFHVDRCVIDGLPETHATREFASRHPGVVFMNFFNEHQRDPAKWDPSARRVRINRTDALDASRLAIRDEKVVLPRQDKTVEEFAVHMAADAKVLDEDDETGIKRYRYVRTGVNHFSFAFTYAWMAATDWSGHRGLLEWMRQRAKDPPGEN